MSKVYALCTINLCYNGEEPGVLEFDSEDEAMDDFRDAVRRHRPTSIEYRYLFRDRATAERANQTDEEEVNVDESLAYKTLDYERAYGFNFDS